MSVLQSPVWRSVQEALGRTVVADAGDGWSFQAVVESAPGHRRLYAPYGPVVRDAAALRAALASMRDAAKQHGCTYVRVEPRGDLTDAQLRDAGLVRSARVQPEATHIVDLDDKTEDELLAGMQSSIRNRVRNHAKKGLSFERSTDPASIEPLLRMLHSVADRSGMTSHPDDYLRTQARVILGQDAGAIYSMVLDGEPVVSSFVYDYDGVRTYAHTAADDAHRKLAPGQILVGLLILDAKQRGLSHFDMWGIWPDAEAGSPHAGITTFKRSFGGRDVQYLGTWELPVRRLQYAAYKTALTVLRREQRA